LWAQEVAVALPLAQKDPTEVILCLVPLPLLVVAVVVPEVTVVDYQEVPGEAQQMGKVLGQETPRALHLLKETLAGLLQS
jgi:hypothetical protein